MKTAFIGLGNMGGGMAKNLARNGHEVHAYDLSVDALERAERNGCRVFSSIKAAVSDVDTVVSMLPNSKVMEQVYTQEVFEHVIENALLIDCSTIDIATTSQIAHAAASRGYAFVDAPVSGGITGADQGTLTFMVGSTPENYQRAERLLSYMGKAVVHAGMNGAGQAAKICNNMLLGVQMLGTCEAFVLAEKLGLSAEMFYQIASQSSGQNWSMTSYCPVPNVGPDSPADNHYHGGFASALMLKDLRLALDAAGHVDGRVPMGEKARDLYEAFIADDNNNGLLDFSSIIKSL